MDAFSSLLSLPCAKLVLAFEALPFSRAHEACRRCYQGVYPYVALGSAGYVRWAVDSLERLLGQPHAEEVDEALMHLAAHAGEATASLCESEMREELQRLFRHLRLVPPTGQTAMRLAMLGLLEDVVSGRLPAGREQAALSCLHEWLADDAGTPALESLERCYWQLDEYEDLRKLGLAQGLPDRQELLDDFRELASDLVEGTSVAREPREDGFYALCIRMPQVEAQGEVNDTAQGEEVAQGEGDEAATSRAARCCLPDLARAERELRPACKARQASKPRCHARRPKAQRGRVCGG